MIVSITKNTEKYNIEHSKAECSVLSVTFKPIMLNVFILSVMMLSVTAPFDFITKMSILKSHMLHSGKADINYSFDNHKSDKVSSIQPRWAWFF